MPQRLFLPLSALASCTRGPVVCYSTKRCRTIQVRLRSETAPNLSRVRRDVAGLLREHRGVGGPLRETSRQRKSVHSGQQGLCRRVCSRRSLKEEEKLLYSANKESSCRLFTTKAVFDQGPPTLTTGRLHQAVPNSETRKCLAFSFALFSHLSDRRGGNVPRGPRLEYPSARHHVTNRVARQAPIFADDARL